MITGPRIVLVVDPDPTFRTLLRTSLKDHLPGFEVSTAASDDEAVTYLQSRPVDVLVADASSDPREGGGTLLGHVRDHHPNLAVVVLSVDDGEQADPLAPSSAPLGILRVVRKPATPAAVAAAVAAAHADVVRGRIGDVTLPTFLNLMQLERKTCSLLVRSGTKKGRLHLLDGDLVNAYSFDLDVDGEDAARHLLAWDTVSIDFERSLHNHNRLIVTPLQELLLQVATQVDEEARWQRSGGSPRGTPSLAPADARDRNVSPEADIPDADPSMNPLARDHAHGDADRAFERLAEALRSLRARQAKAVRSLREADAAFTAASEASASAFTTASPDDDASSATPWADVSRLAQRIASAAERLVIVADEPGR